MNPIRFLLNIALLPYFCIIFRFVWLIHLGVITSYALVIVSTCVERCAGHAYYPLAFSFISSLRDLLLQ